MPPGAGSEFQESVGTEFVAPGDRRRSAPSVPESGENPVRPRDAVRIAGHTEADPELADASRAARAGANDVPERTHRERFEVEIHRRRAEGRSQHPVQRAETAEEGRFPRAVFPHEQRDRAQTRRLDAPETPNILQQEFRGPGHGGYTVSRKGRAPVAECAIRVSRVVPTPTTPAPARVGGSTGRRSPAPR